MEKRPRMNVLLVGPEREDNLSLRYLASSLLAAGHRVERVVFNSAADTQHVLEKSRGFDVVGLSLCFQARAREFLALAEGVKALEPETTVVAGGHFATCAADDLMEHHPQIDVIVLHEGEHTLVELADAGFEPARLGRIAGIIYRDGTTVTRTAPRPIEPDLDSLPFPDRRGRVRRHAGVPTAYVMGSRGCVASCDYCCISTLHRTAPGPRFRQRSPENVADEMAELYHGHGVRQFIFHDDNFLVPSARRNHLRLDALERAWARRGIRDIGIVIKCRPPDIDRSVLARLARMGLLRVFLGVESASEDGLCSIGRRQAVADSDSALDLCRELGVSAQFTLMCFHPEATPATIRADLDFFRRHAHHALNFCRAEIYAGTPLEHRMIAAGRARGSYLARTYSISDPVADTASRLAVRMFRDRCWATDSLTEQVIGMDHLAAVLGRFHGSAEATALRGAIARWRDAANHDLVDLLDDLLRTCVETRGIDDPELRRRARELVLRERASRVLLVEQGVVLRRALDAVAGAFDDKAARPAGRLGRAIARTAATVIAASVIGCGGPGCPPGVSEYAPDPLVDTDGDGLPDECEDTVFGTYRNSADTDRDGVLDGDEDHDGDGLTNAEEQAIAGEYECLDATNPFGDSDGDGLPDQCETDVFGTSPTDDDTDGDGVLDGDEDSDGDGMTNAAEQALAGEDRCEDIGVSEYAPEPFGDEDGDGLPNQCEEEIFGTSMWSEDSDGDGVLDGDEDSDGDGMTNAEEQALAGEDRCEDIGVSEYAPEPFGDEDGDGLPNQCEEEIFGTSPYNADTDGDGVPDGAEDHDGDGMTNAEEQEVFGDEACGDASPGKSG